MNNAVLSLEKNQLIHFYLSSFKNPIKTLGYAKNVSLAMYALRQLAKIIYSVANAILIFMFNVEE